MMRINRLPIFYTFLLVALNIVAVLIAYKKYAEFQKKNELNMKAQIEFVVVKDSLEKSNQACQETGDSLRKISNRLKIELESCTNDYKTKLHDWDDLNKRYNDIMEKGEEMEKKNSAQMDYLKKLEDEKSLCDDAKKRCEIKETDKNDQIAKLHENIKKLTEEKLQIQNEKESDVKKIENLEMEKDKLKQQLNDLNEKNKKINEQDQQRVKQDQKEQSNAKETAVEGHEEPGEDLNAHDQEPAVNIQKKKP